MPACTRCCRWRTSTPTRPGPEHAWALGGTAGSADRRDDPLGARGAGAFPCTLFGAVAHLRLPHPQPAHASRARSPARLLGAAAARRGGDARVPRRQLLGERDFSSFRAAECQSPHADAPADRGRRRAPRRRRSRSRVRANAFLHHMVRNIAGSLLLVGAGDRAPGWLAEVLEARDRTAGRADGAATGAVFRRGRIPGRVRPAVRPRASGRLGAGAPGDPP